MYLCLSTTIHFLLSEAKQSDKDFVLVVFKDDEGMAVVPRTRVVGNRRQSYNLKWSNNKEY